MNSLAKLLPVVAVAVTVPAWAIAPSDDAKQDATTAASQSAKPAPSKDQSARKPAKGEGHGPTAVMDRATPTAKSSTSDPSDKHPPTARMDRSTPDQKSPASKSHGDTDANGTQGPSTAK